MNVQEERPSLEICLKRTHKRPGSFVTGAVIPHMSRGKTLYVEMFTISLIGSIQLGGAEHKPSSTSGNEDTVIFLNLETLLDEHPITLHDRFVSVFTFIIPVEPGVAEAEFRPWEPRHRTPEPKALPPSGDLGNGNIIDYSLKVAIRDDTSGDDISATLPLTFSRVRTSGTPRADEQHMVVRQTLSDQGRHMSVELALDCPKSFVQEETFPLSLRLLCEVLSPAAEHVPTLRLASCWVQLFEQTNIRITPINKQSYVKQHGIASRDVLASKDGLLPVITVEGLNLSDILGRPAIPCAFAPTFDCANIRRFYGIKILIQVQYDQTSCDLEFSIDDVTLWPSETYSMARLAEEEERRMEEHRYPDEDEWPPFGLLPK